jgi:X-X-X-Leu-X-X-Gly heptad repeat protein
MTQRLAGVLAVALITTTACGQSAEQKQAEEAAKSVAEAAKSGANQMAAGAAAMAKGLEQMAKGVQGKVDVLPFEKLGEAFPEVSGWKRSDVKGESRNMPFAMSQSEATYEKGDARVNLEVIDTALNQMIMAPFSMYLVQNYSERSSNGYRKGTTFKGEPAFEEVRNSSRTGEITVVVGKRFIVKAQGRRVDGVEPAREILDKMDFSKLTAAK